MKIRLLSDLHLEFLDETKCNELVEQITSSTAPRVTILAGDICEYSTLISGPIFRANFIKKLAQWCPQVLYIKGNHEMYGSNTSQCDDLQRKALEAIDSFRVSILDRSIWKVSNTRIMGCTMYWSMPPRAAGFIRDYHTVENLVPWVYDECQKDQAFLHDEMKEGDIVVTHLCPSEKSGDPRFQRDPGNHFFINEMEHLIFERKPSHWFHGHTHQPCDYILEKTRVLANPRGYPGEAQLEPLFDPKLDVEI